MSDALQSFGQRWNKKGYGHYPVQVRQLTAVEAAWLGAMVDGEGHITGPYNHLYVTNTNVEIISTILRLIGIGRVSMGTKVPGMKTVWRFALTRINDLAALFPQLSPYSMKAQEVLGV